MGYGEIDQLAINTIRLLAVRFLCPSLTASCSFTPSFCPAISPHDEIVPREWDTRDRDSG